MGGFLFQTKAQWFPNAAHWGWLYVIYCGGLFFKLFLISVPVRRDSRDLKNPLFFLKKKYFFSRSGWKKGVFFWSLFLQSLVNLCMETPMLISPVSSEAYGQQFFDQGVMCWLNEWKQAASLPVHVISCSVGDQEVISEGMMLLPWSCFSSVWLQSRKASPIFRTAPKLVLKLLWSHQE